MQQDTAKRSNLLKIKKIYFLIAIALLIVSLTTLSSFATSKEIIFSEQLKSEIGKNTELIVQYIDSIEKDIDAFNKNKSRYTEARKLYKEIEFYTEYHFPFYSKYFINGPLVDKAEYEYGFKTFVPHGFQVIESYLFTNTTDTTIDIKYELSLLKQSFNYIKTQAATKKNSSTATIDMMRFEIIRIMSLYLNGYDCTINKQNLKETEHILERFKTLLDALLVDHTKTENCKKIIRASNLYLQKNNDYDKFPRLNFIVKYLIPLYEEMHSLYTEDAIKNQTTFAINIRSRKFFDEKWLNKNYFSVVLKDSLLRKQQIELGELLFFDPILSGNNQRACASCHDPNKGFGGSSDFNLSFDAKSKLKRNTPSLLNVLFQKNFFMDGRSLQLEDQASEVLTNHSEMFSDPNETVIKLRQSPGYKKYFSKAFKNTEDTLITYYAILKSLSEYERSLISLNSKFDKYLRGDAKQLTQDEINGYTVFSGKALCGSCHFFPLFNGLVPPFYSDNEFEVIGTPGDKTNKKIDADSGRFHVTKNNIHLLSFKTPGIRNVELTGPYMHNGVFTTIDEVIDFYKKGGGKGLGIPIENQTLPFDSLQLDKKEINQLKKFLLTLTDKTHPPKVPKSLPIVNIKGLEHRKVGGVY